MRRTLLLGGIFLTTSLRCGSEATAQHLDLTSQSREIFCEFQHRLVLFGDVLFQVRYLLFESRNRFAHFAGDWVATFGVLAAFRKLSISGTTTRV